ncbi:hypothetical protein EPIR_1673 [Erwinia piriflorinigrans CFBP 5888]|uniref:Uncharacterized protein n=1 Tax=Erwinia piriflorinigrans CFBP 5888 TaxID=1161919 RepID=V5Z722_9GAMM|nr:hypothetical protein EPIR_1673 [Erwinia piriflorinigrans CFBP 5888]
MVPEGSSHRVFSFTMTVLNAMGNIQNLRQNVAKQENEIDKV